MGVALATLAWPKVTMLLILIFVTVVFNELITAKVREKLIKLTSKPQHRKKDKTGHQKKNDTNDERHFQ